MNNHFKNLESALTDLFADGKEQVHILADFDGTLTKDFINGKKAVALISVLRDHPGYLSPEYQAAAKALFNIYHPFENNLELSLSERKDKMQEWWQKHIQLLIESGLKYQHIEKASTSGIIQFKEGVKEFFELTNRLDIPVIIFSASGLGEAVPIFCQHEKVAFPNVHFLVNSFQWGDEGHAIGYSSPIIHSLNKDETLLSAFPDIYQEIKDKPNVLLLGNNSGDLGMVEGFAYKKLLSIGFVDPEEMEKKPVLEKYFNQVIVDGYDEINKVLKTIL